MHPHIIIESKGKPRKAKDLVFNLSVRMCNDLIFDKVVLLGSLVMCPYGVPKCVDSAKVCDFEEGREV